MKKLTYQLQLKAFNIIVCDDYINNNVKCYHYCTNCDYYFMHIPSKFKKLRQCPRCHEYYTYLLYFPRLDIYKIGYSSNLFKRRNDFNEESNVILYITHETEHKARALEREWLNNIKQFRVSDYYIYLGNTEIFKLPNNFFN